MTLNPTLMYQLADSVKLHTSCSIDSDYGMRAVLGAEYEFSQETKMTVQYMENVKNLTELSDTMVVL